MLFLPDFRHGNPYQQRLADHLRDHGFVVEFSAGDARRSLARQLVGRRTLDVVHVHWPENYVSSASRAKLLVRAGLFLLLLRLVRLRGLRIVWTVHNLDFHEPRHPALEEAFRRRLAGVCHGLAVHFPGGRELVRERLRVAAKTPIALTPLGHDPPPDASLRPPRGPGEPFVFCHLGELRAYKNVPLVVDAFRGLSDPLLRLVVAGRVHEPALERRLRAAAGDDPRVALRVGFLDDEELAGHLRDADAFVLGGADFFTSASALQAAGWGLVVVAPPHPHLASFLDPDGWVRYRAGDVDALREALRLAAQRTEGGAANRRRSLVLTYPRLAAGTAALYRLILRPERRPPGP